MTRMVKIMPTCLVIIFFEPLSFQALGGIVFVKKN